MIATLITVWITNVFTCVPIYTFNYIIGAWLTDANFPLQHFKISTMSELLNMGWKVIGTLWLGSIVVGFVAALATYLISVPLIVVYQEHRLALKRKRKAVRSKVL